MRHRHLELLVDTIVVLNVLTWIVGILIILNLASGGACG